MHFMVNRSEAAVAFNGSKVNFWIDITLTLSSFWIVALTCYIRGVIPGGSGSVLAPPDFSRSVISTRRADYAPTLLLAPRIFRPSFGPAHSQEKVLYVATATWHYFVKTLSNGGLKGDEHRSVKSKEFCRPIFCLLALLIFLYVLICKKVQLRGKAIAFHW